MTSMCKNRTCKARVVPRYIFTARHNLGFHIRYDPIEHRADEDDLQTPLDTLHTCAHTHTHAHTPSASFKIQWGQGDGTRSICSTLSFAFHASRLFFEVAILWCSQRDTLSLFQFPCQSNVVWRGEAGKSQRDTSLALKDPARKKGTERELSEI